MSRTNRNPDPEIAALVAEAARTKGTMASGTLVIEGIRARIQAGIDAAGVLGATPEQLQALTDVTEGLAVDGAAMAAAIANDESGPINTPTPGPGGENPSGDGRQNS